MTSTIIALVAAACVAGPLDQRIVHNNPDSYRLLSNVHAGAGEMKFCRLLNSSAFSSNFRFVHAGVILPKGGIGHHFHHRMEEMYVILDGEAEFTINGRTAKLKGPVAVPCKMGQSHGLYNSSDKPIRWLNFAVSSEKGKGDSFDLDDDRVGARLDPKAVFVSTPLTRERLRPQEQFYGGEGTVKYRRALPSEIFRSPWSYVDHLVIPPGASIGQRRLVDMEEVVYVIEGEGLLRVDGEQARVKQGDTIPIRFGEGQSFVNRSPNDLELLVIGVAREKP